MNYQEAMSRLEAYGTEQNRKIFPRHGSSTNLFGVSFANLKLMKKEIKKDQELAEQLWESGNEDARTLALMIADPKQVSEELADKWVQSTAYPLLLDSLANDVVSKTPFALEKMKVWTRSEDEWIGRCGWSLVYAIALNDAKLPDEFFTEYLEMIAGNIQTSKNRKKEGMHTALISIGARSEALEAEVARVLAEVGVVEIDHGETNCKTPDVMEYIQKMKQRKQKKKA
jgi:3-methyladenine DNA glycosylase AlkD